MHCVLSNTPAHSVNEVTDMGHDDVIIWKHFPRYWPFVRGVEFPSQKPVTRSVDVFFYLCLYKRLSKQADDLRCHRAHFDVTVMWCHTEVSDTFDKIISRVKFSVRFVIIWFAMVIRCSRMETDVLSLRMSSMDADEFCFRLSTFRLIHNQEQSVWKLKYQNMSFVYFVFLFKRPN